MKEAYEELNKNNEILNKRIEEKEEENKNILNEMNILKKESEEGKNKIEENTKLKNNYYLLVNEFNKLKNYYNQVYEQAENLLKENAQLKNSNISDDKYKEGYEKVSKLFNETKVKNIKLQSEIERLNQIIEEKKEKYKKYKIESLSLDYLRPYDFSDIQKKYGNYENIISKPKIKPEINDKNE